MSDFVVGIDLGTSHTVVASATMADPVPRIFPIAQRVGASAEDRLRWLPSCAYAGFEGELSALEHLDETDGWALGEFARRRGAEVPGRLITSAKSWLCHPRVDREAPILPWGAGEEAPKLSPVEASARFLKRIRITWDQEHPGAALAHQEVVLTVPASFDEAARALTLRAATSVGLRVRLLEEPQAALLASMARGALGDFGASDSAFVLVCDVGGGTTDLSLFEVKGAEVTRRAVGPHLLLGGDNMDLAIAHALEPQLVVEGERLDQARFGTLSMLARGAKEKLLGETPPDDVRVALAERGSSLVGRTRSASLTRESAERLVIEGFFPAVSAEAGAGRRRAGLVALGLPYEREVAISKHVVSFIRAQLPAGGGLDAVLLNGGVFHSPSIRARLLEVLSSTLNRTPILLLGEDPDLAVALGAVRFGLALRGVGPKILGGAPRSYFIGASAGEAERFAICVLPKGTGEGVAQTADSRPLKLRTGQLSRFELYGSDQDARAGDLVDASNEGLRLEATLSTNVQANPGEREVNVDLIAELTSVGTLDISCLERLAGEGEGSRRRFRLSFEIRPNAEEAEPAALPRRSSTEVDRALEAVTRVFGKGQDPDERSAKDLQRELEKLLGAREEWPADTTRALADRLLQHEKGRRRSVDHERVFFQLLGFSMRPGFGAPGDEQRARELERIFLERLVSSKEARTVQQFLIALRRVAAGFSEQAQVRLRQEFDPFIAPPDAKLKRPKWIAADIAEPELLDLLSQLERVPAQRRAELGNWVLERTWTRRDPRLWAAIGRIGARAPLFASVHQVVAPPQVEKWLDQLLRDKWADLPTAPRATAELSRKTGDRARDVSTGMQQRVIARLEKEHAAANLIEQVREAMPIAAAEKANFLGERLPAGLQLLGDDDSP